MRLQKKVKLDPSGNVASEKIEHVRERWQDWFYFRVDISYIGDDLPLPAGYYRTKYDKERQVYTYFVWYCWPFAKIWSLIDLFL